MITDIKSEIKKLANPKKAKTLQRFFKTGKGEYGEGDIFLGLTVPQSRSISTIYYAQITFFDIEDLLKSKIHEERLIALQMLRLKFEKLAGVQEKIYQFYLNHTKYINNWDLIDGTADVIIGGFLFGKDTKILKKLAQSQSVWEKRIAMIATYYFLKNGQSEETQKIAKILLQDKHDLIQKAVGWMLREMGKRCSRKILGDFLKEHYKTMPRTALRYAIEHFPEEKRKAYLKGIV